MALGHEEKKSVRRSGCQRGKVASDFFLEPRFASIGRLQDRLGAGETGPEHFPDVAEILLPRRVQFDHRKIERAEAPAHPPPREIRPGRAVPPIPAERTRQRARRACPSCTRAGASRMRCAAKRASSRMMKSLAVSGLAFAAGMITARSHRATRNLRLYFTNAIFPSTASAAMTSPSRKRPARISKESGSRTLRWMARLSGRAP